MNLAHDVFSGISHSHIVGGKRVNSGVLRVKINSSTAVLNPICPLLRLFGAHHIFHVAGYGFCVLLYIVLLTLTS